MEHGYSNVYSRLNTPNPHFNPGPSPAALAAATRITEETFRDIYKLAIFLDEIAEEARVNERRRIFNMSFVELFREFWAGRKLYQK